MKLIYTFLFTIFAISFSVAQSTCVPDETYRDTLGVFPPPFDTLAENPVGGIDKTACIDKPYEFVFTIAIGDSLRVPNIGAFVIDSIVLSPDTAIGGLPEGMTFNCGTENCVFYKGDLNCVSITGVPDPSNPTGDYPLTITGVFHSGVLALEQTVPGDLFPGAYTLRLEESGSEACTTSSLKLVEQVKLDMSIAPNPTKDFARLNLNVPETDTYTYRIYNLLGAEVFSTPMRLSAGINQYELDLSFLDNGLYLYSLNNDKYQLTKRLIIRK